MTNPLLRQSLDVNTKIYNRLKAALRLNLRRQIFVAICDDVALRDRLADQLQKEVTYAAISARRQGQIAEARRLRIYPRLVTLRLDLANPNPINQMSQWLRQFPPPAAAGSAMPAFQLIGVEQLSRQPASSQWLFLNYLQSFERSLPALESSLLLWVPRPWGRMIPQSAPDFWRCRTAVFEFEGDPTPLPIAALPQSTVPTSIFLQPQRQSPPAQPPTSAELSPDEVALLKSELAMPSSDVAPLPVASSAPRQKNSTAALPAAAPPNEVENAIAAASETPSETPTAADQGVANKADTPIKDGSGPVDNQPVEEVSESTADQPVAARTQDLSEALRELLDDSVPDATHIYGDKANASTHTPVDYNAAAPQDSLPSDALASTAGQDQPEASSDISPQKDVNAPLDGAQASETQADQTPTEDAAFPLSAAPPPSQPFGLGAHTTPEDQAEQSAAIADDADDDVFNVTLGLPPLTDSFTLDDLALFDPADSASSSSTPSDAVADSSPSGPAVVDPSSPPIQEEDRSGVAIDPEADSGDSELEIADAAPTYVYSGVVDSPVRSTAVPEPSSPTELMQLFADEASDPRVLNVLRQIRGLQEQQAPPTVLAGAYRALGNLFRDRIEQGEISPPTLQRAMVAYQQVLQYTPEDSPMRAEVLNDMGNLSWLLSRCSQGAEQCLPHLHHSIQSYQQALAQIAPETHPQSYPLNQNILGAAYGDLARYQNPADNLQKSTQAYQEALRYRSAEQDPMRYASTQNNLGTTYWNLAQHQEPIHHLKAAIAAYDSALSYYKPEQDALNYAMIQNNLGTAYWNLAQHEHSEEWLRQAIKAYELALEYRTLEAAPAAFAATQNNLGTAHWHVANYIDEEPQARFSSLKQAMRAYEAALQAVDYLRQSDRPTPLNFDVTATRNNLGLVQYQTATDSQFDTSELSETYLNAALEHHLAALQGWQGRPELRQTALNCVIQTLQAIYNTKGLVGQNLALSNVPGQLLPEILPKL